MHPPIECHRTCQRHNGHRNIIQQESGDSISDSRESRTLRQQFERFFVVEVHVSVPCLCRCLWPLWQRNHYEVHMEDECCKGTSKAAILRSCTLSTRTLPKIAGSAHIQHAAIQSMPPKNYRADILDHAPLHRKVPWLLLRALWQIWHQFACSTSSSTAQQQLL